MLGIRQFGLYVRDVDFTLFTLRRNLQHSLVIRYGPEFDLFVLLQSLDQGGSVEAKPRIDTWGADFSKHIITGESMELG